VAGVTDRPPPLSALLDGLAVEDLSRCSGDDICAVMEEMVLHRDYPCLGARSVFHRHRAAVHVFERLGEAESARALLQGLEQFAAQTRVEEGFASFVAAFRGPRMESEERFEQLLWRELALLAEADDQSWSPSVSAHPDDPHFGFSVAGTAYYVVGLHPGASREARRAPLPALVFNLHEQFDRLRSDGNYVRMRDTIRRRDTELQGSVNPMMDDHGSSSEARQYSGRAVAADWRPPFDTGRER
jgi:FPC/CPF motif-containing protein YcgG